ncbi:MAG: ribulose-phosphate 3-epimerase [Candidatus Yanofskybacteria bacterium]|nr:ribulose-phosphate 3-epimerase [Candidatus Yanofskybacteria bacterium]
MNKVIPAIIANSAEDLEKKLRIVEPYVDRVHLDVMDGDFVPNKTIAGYEEISKLETKLNFDVHLMVNNPEGQIYFWYQTKADRFLIHVESQADLRGLIDQIHSNNRMAGLVLNPDTPAEVIQEFVDDIDFVQFMTVDPGQYGADFREEVVSKIGNFHAKYPSMPIGVDGGVNPQTAPKLLAAGVSVFVVGSYIFSSEDVGKAIEELKTIVENK